MGRRAELWDLRGGRGRGGAGRLWPAGLFWGERVLRVAASCGQSSPESHLTLPLPQPPHPKIKKLED